MYQFARLCHSKFVRRVHGFTWTVKWEVDICGHGEWHVREALVWLYLILRLVQPLKLLKHSQPLLEIKSRYFPLWIWPLSKALLDTSQNTLSLQDFFNRIFSFELEFMNDCPIRRKGTLLNCPRNRRSLLQNIQDRTRAEHGRSNELDRWIEVHQCKCHLGSNRDPTRSWVNIRSRSQFKKLNKS